MILNVEGLTFHYPSNQVLHDVSFSLEKGECLAVLGTNGAGKSTLLKCLTKILKPQEGTVVVSDQEVKKMTANHLAQKVGYVSQYNPMTRTTVFDAVLLGRKPYIRWEATEADYEMVDQTLEMMGLKDYAMRYTDELSGGEYQKVVIARALAQKPELLMFDEPTSSLDLKNQLEVIDTIKKVVKDSGISAVVTIHDLNLALRLANKFIFLKEGNIFAAGGKEIFNEENINAVYSVPVQIQSIKDHLVVIPH
jgi:iron complex transport system ATP-binding protein